MTLRGSFLSSFGAAHGSGFDSQSRSAGFAVGSSSDGHSVAEPFDAGRSAGAFFAEPRSDFASGGGAAVGEDEGVALD